jgi:hypothetical protein
MIQQQFGERRVLVGELHRTKQIWHFWTLPGDYVSLRQPRMDKHALAIISIVGSSLDCLGALYLAYDQLGGEHGPLRTLTRAVTYGVLFGVGYGLALGPFFGVTSGVAHGITLAWEFSREARRKTDRRIWRDAVASAIRGSGFALGAAHLYGWTFGAVFGILSAVSQVIAYQIGIRPTLDYQPASRPRLTKRQFWSSVNRVVGYTIAGYISATVAHQETRAWAFGIKAGLAIGAVTAVVVTFAPFVEWTADHVPAKRMGVFGVALILIGFTLQAVQYWVTLMDIPVR